MCEFISVIAGQMAPAFVRGLQIVTQSGRLCKDKIFIGRVCPWACPTVGDVGRRVASNMHQDMHIMCTRLLPCPVSIKSAGTAAGADLTV